jgi:hypothetical protein
MAKKYIELHAATTNIKQLHDYNKTTRLDKCAQRPPTPRAVLRAAHFAIAITVQDGFFSCVRSGDRA